MRRILVAPLALVLAGCKKDPPPPAADPPAAATSAAAPTSAAPSATAAAANEGGAKVTLRFTGTFKALNPSGSILLEAGEVFYALDDKGPRQLKDLRRGTRSERTKNSFVGRAGECLFINRWDQSAETGHNIVNDPLKRTGDFWAAAEFAGTEDRGHFLTDVLPWRDGRYLGVLHHSSPTDSLSFMVACGKGGATPTFTPFPKPPAEGASASAAPAQSAAPSPKPAASASASASTSASGSAAAPATPAPPSTPAAPETASNPCDQRLSWERIAGPEGRMAIAKSGEIFVLGHECGALQRGGEKPALVERWDANGKKLGVDVLPVSPGLLTLAAGTAEQVFALGGDTKKGVVMRLAGGTWTVETTPITAVVRKGVVDASGALWMLTDGAQVWRRSPSGTYERVEIPEGTGAVTAIATTGARVWLALQNKLLASGPAEAVVDLKPIEITKYKGSDYWDFAAGPYCATPYVKVGLLKQPGADVDKAFPDLRAQLKTAGVGKVDAVWEDRGGQQWLGLRMPSVDLSHKLVATIKAADPKAAAIAICNDPRGNFVKKTTPLE